MMGRLKRTKQDIIFSTCVRERYDWTCCGTKTDGTLCGRHFPEDDHGGLQCSHVFSRRHARIRHMPENAVAHCFTCHREYGENPVIGGAWAREYLGNYTIDMLIEKRREIYKLTKYQKEEMFQHYKSEHLRLLKARVDGATGILHLVGYE